MVHHDGVVPLSHSSGPDWVYHDDSQCHKDDIFDSSLLQDKESCGLRLNRGVRGL